MTYLHEFMGISNERHQMLGQILQEHVLVSSKIGDVLKALVEDPELTPDEKVYVAWKWGDNRSRTKNWKLNLPFLK